MARRRPRFLPARPRLPDGSLLRPSWPPSRHGRRAARAVVAPALASAARDPRACPAARDRGVPRPDVRLRLGQHRQRLLARAGRQARLGELGRAVRARTPPELGVAGARARGRGALGDVAQLAALARSWAKTSAISSAVST